MLCWLPGNPSVLTEWYQSSLVKFSTRKPINALPKCQTIPLKWMKHSKGWLTVAQSEQSVRFCSLLFFSASVSAPMRWTGALISRGWLQWKFQARGSVCVQIYVLWMCFYKCVCVFVPLPACLPACDERVRECAFVHRSARVCMCLGMCTWVFVCVYMCVYLVSICLSVTLMSYIIAPKRKALASLQHAR